MKLFVGQIGRSADDAELRQLLEPYGSVLEVSVIKDKATGTSKGAYAPLVSTQHLASHVVGGCLIRGEFFMTFLWTSRLFCEAWRREKYILYSCWKKRATVFGLQ